MQTSLQSVLNQFIQLVLNQFAVKFETILQSVQTSL